MKDSFGNEINIGDKFTISYGKKSETGLSDATVTKLTDKFEPISNDFKNYTEEIITERNSYSSQIIPICRLETFNKELKITQEQYTVIKTCLIENKRINRIEEDIAMGEELEFGYKDDKVIFCYNKFMNTLEYNDL